MMRASKPLTPIERFLGPAAATGNPFAMLGVSSDVRDEREVQAALHRRLVRLGARPDARTPEADEVRLALHAAAAQLGDPLVRRHLRIIWTTSRSRMREPATPGVRRASAYSQDTGGQAPGLGAFHDLALRVLARSGGWNRRSRRRLAALAHAMGIAPSLLAGTLRSLWTDRISAAVNGGATGAFPIARVEVATASAAGVSALLPAGPGSKSAAAQNRPTEPSRDRSGVVAQLRRRQRALAGALGLVVVVSITGIAAWRLSRAGSHRHTEPSNSAASIASGQQITPAAPIAPQANSAQGPVAHADSATGQGVDCIEQAVVASANLLGAAAIRGRIDSASESAALNNVASCWGSLATDHFLQTLNVALATPASAIVAAPAASAPLTSPAMMSASAFAEGLRAGRAALLRTGSSGMARQSFLDAALGALATNVSHLPPIRRTDERSQDENAIAALWSAWSSDVLALGEAAGRTDLRGSSRFAAASSVVLGLDALESLMTQAPAPARDTSTKAAILAVLPLLDFGADASDATARIAGRRLLAWFGDRRIGADDLAVVTGYFVDDRAIVGIRSDMRLPAHAGRAPRLALRDRYARLLGVASTASPMALSTTWSDAALGALREAPASGVIKALRASALFARLNEAAALRWNGDTSASAQITANIYAGIEHAPEVAGLGGVAPIRDAPADDGVWMLQYAAAGRGVEAKTKAIFNLEARSAPLGPVDADMLTIVAVSDPEPRVRARAQRLVGKLAIQPTIINGLLEALPRARRTLSVTGLIEELSGHSLPAPDSAQWFPVAHRLLAAALAEKIERTSAGAIVDKFERAIQEASQGFANAVAPGVEKSASAPRAPDGSTVATLEGAGAMALLAEARLLGAGLRRDAVAPDALAQRWRVQDDLAQSPVRQSAAWAAALAEALALVVGSERPTAVKDASRAIHAMSALEQAARSSAEQLAIALSTQTTLWMLRFGDADGVAAVVSRARSIARSEPGAPGVSVATLAHWRTSIDVAKQKGAWAQFALAEDIASQAAGAGDLAIARWLYVGVLADASGPSARSVSLALRDIATSADERDWLSAMADASTQATEKQRNPPWRMGETQSRDGDPEQARLAAAEALLRYRAGDRREAKDILQSVQGAERALREALLDYPDGVTAILADMQVEPRCHECQNLRYIKKGPNANDLQLCPVCHGDPGPDLDGVRLLAVLHAEMALLGESSTRFATTLRSADAHPLSVLDPWLLTARYGDLRQSSQDDR